MSDITQLLSAAEAGDPVATDALLPLVYDELRKLAAVRLSAEAPGQTLQPTALVHEAYLRLLGPGGTVSWDHRGHFFAAAAEAMRRILVERARRKRRHRHGGNAARVIVELEQVAGADAKCDLSELLALDEAIAALERHDPRAAELVKLRFFAGLTMSQAAEATGVPLRTAERDWAYARAWLARSMGRNGGQQDAG